MTNYEKLVETLRWTANEYKGSIMDEYDKDTMNAAADAIEALQAQLPKRGEIVRCKECIHFTQSGWCDREFDWFPVDENDFCSMAEKIEVQDGANRGF